MFSKWNLKNDKFVAEKITFKNLFKGQPRPQLQIGQVVQLGKAFSQTPHNLQLGARLAFKVKTWKLKSEDLSEHLSLKT